MLQGFLRRSWIKSWPTSQGTLRRRGACEEAWLRQGEVHKQGGGHKQGEGTRKEGIQARRGPQGQMQGGGQKDKYEERGTATVSEQIEPDKATHCSLIDGISRTFLSLESAAFSQQAKK